MSVLPLWLALPALAFLLLVPGFLTLNLVLSFGKTDTGPTEAGLKPAEKLFWTLTLSLFWAGWLSLLLAEFALFSIWLLLALLLVWSGATGSWLWRRGYQAEWWRGRLHGPDWKRVGLDGWLLVVILVGATGLFYLAPHETLAGSQDSGVYYATGANIARTGAILNYDPLLEAVWQVSQNPQVGPKVVPQVLQGPAKQENRALFSRHLRLPGFFVPNNEDGLAAGQVVPQGFHLYPSYLALGYALFGVRGESLVTPLLGVMAVFAVYLACYRLFPARRQRWIAPVATGLLALNAIQIWFSRESLWEGLGEFLVFVAVYSFTLIQRSEGVGDRGSGVRGQKGSGVGGQGSEGVGGRGLEAGDRELEQSLSSETPADPRSLTPDPRSPSLLGGLGVGLAMGLICLAHSQFPFLVWVLGPYLLWMRLTRRWGLPQWLMLVAFGLLFFQAVLHIRLFSLAYFEYIYHNIIIEARYRLNWYIPVVTVGLFALIVIDGMPNRVRAFEGWVRRHWRWPTAALALLSLFYTFYSYFVLVSHISVDQHSQYPTRYWSLSSYIGAPTTEGSERNLLRLGWYFSPVGMILVFVGLAWLLWRQLDARTGFLLALMAGITLVFLDTNYTQENYIYSLRRYVVVTVPAFSIFMAYALFEALPDVVGLLTGLLRRRRRLAYVQTASDGGPTGMAFAMLPILKTEPPVPPPNQESHPATAPKTPAWTLALSMALTGGLVLFMVWTGRTVFTLSEYGSGDGQPGLIAQFDELAGRFGPKDVLLWAGDRDPDGKVATPLTYVYGHPGFGLTNAVKNDEVAALISQWENQGYHVKALLGPNGGRLAPTGYELSFQSAFTLKLRQFEQLSIQKPYGVQLNSLSYAIYDVHKVGQEASFAASAGQGRPATPDGWDLKIGQNDYPSLIEGFYEAEKDKDGTLYRWTQQNGVMRVPCLTPDGAGGKLSVTLSAGQRPANKGPVAVSVYLSNYRYADENDKRVTLGQARLTSQPQIFTFDIPANSPYLSCSRSGAGASLNSLVLWLSNEQPTVFVPAQSGDSPDVRQLSFKVYGLKLVAG